MTLKEFFDLLAVNPAYIIGFFLLIPLAAFVGTVIGKGEEDETVWKFYYSTLIYLAAIPGIFSVTLNIYLLVTKKGLKPRTFSATNLLGYILLKYLYSSSFALINAGLNPILSLAKERL